MGTWFRRRSTWTGALVGLVISVGAPLGLWALLRICGLDPSAGAGRVALLYSAIGTAFMFSLLGGISGLLIDRQRDAALRDGLTGLYNRRFLRESLPRLQAAAARAKEPLCVIMLDLDHFKLVNDRHGHLIGDQTLRAVATTLERSSRRSDLVARYGGEEFAVLCPGTDCETGLQVADRLREAVAAIGPEALGHPGPQTVSLGVAVQSPSVELSPEALLDHADEALYAAKDGGRNRSIAWLDGAKFQ